MGPLFVLVLLSTLGTLCTPLVSAVASIAIAVDSSTLAMGHVTAGRLP